MTKNQYVIKYLNNKILLAELQSHTKYAGKDLLKSSPDTVNITIAKVLAGKGYKVNIAIKRKEYSVSEIITGHIKSKYKAEGWTVKQTIYDYIRTGDCEVCGTKMNYVNPDDFTATCPKCEVKRKAKYILKAYNRVDFDSCKKIMIDKLNENKIDSFYLQLIRWVKKELKEVL